MRARDIMTTSVLAVTPDDLIGKAAQLMYDGDVGLLPVVQDYDDWQLIGVITDRDIAIRHVALAHRPVCRVRDHMTIEPLQVVRPDDHVHDVAGRMRHDQVRRLPVVGAEHRLLGIISVADLVLAIGGNEPRLIEQLMEGISEPTLAHA